MDLNGEEDEDYEVKPLAKEGKFSVRKRKKQEARICKPAALRK
jgi:hypothetical protein